MIGFALLMLAAEDMQNQAAPPAAVEDVRKQFGRGRFQTGNNEQGLTCKVTKSTGDPRLDEGFCEAFRACSSEAGPNIFALMPCMSKKQEELFIRIAAERTADGGQ